MFRRPEQMLSSALKFGTTRHLAPHPRQVAGAPTLGIPPLKWVYGDDLGNIRRLIDTNLKATENSSVASITFDPTNGQFLDTEGQPITREAIHLLAEEADLGREASAGGSTIARNAVLRSLVRREGQAGRGTDGRSAGLLENLVRLGSEFGEATRRIFYSRGNVGTKPASAERVAKIQAVIDAIRDTWANAPQIIVVRDMADEAIPEAARREDAKQRSQGASGAEGFYHDGKVWLVASELNRDRDVVRVLLHESLGHHGLRGVFGKELGSILDQIAVRRPADMRRKATQYKLKLTDAEQRQQVAEEVLSELAQTSPEIGFVKRAIAAIRSWLREHVPGFEGMEFSDAELVRSFVIPARRYVQDGAGAGAGSATNPDGVMFSRSLGSAANAIADKFNRGPTIVGNTGRQYTAAQLAAMKNVGFQTEAPTLQERAQALWKDAGKKMAQGLVDQFAPVKAIDGTAYGLLRLAKGASGAFDVLLNGGQLKLNDGVYDFDATKRGGVVDTLLKPLQGEHHDFLRWIAANRAERLMDRGKENLFTPDDIAAFKSLANGRTTFDYTIKNGPQAGQVTRERSRIYADSLKTFNEFSANVLDMAEQSGLIDGEARKLWENEFYVPFYRVEDDGSVAGADIKNGAVRQQAFKPLTGRTEKLNADLLDNTLMNWAHLLDA
ncbi:MAG: hypothetical protein ACTS8S_14045, partial [Giesbergeria sp.]